MRRPSSASRWIRTGSNVLVPRRNALRTGFTAFVAAMMARALPGCGDDEAATGSGGGTGSGGSGAAGPGVGSTGSTGSVGSGGGGGGTGESPFPVRDLPELPALVSLIADIGPLGDPDENGVRLPAGFTARILAVTEETPVADGDYAWHLNPDGGATYITEDGGWIYVSNSEAPVIGGVGALRFDADGELIDAYPILTGTNINCAGGRTPWHTWLSCEEAPSGQVFECDPWGEVEAVVRPALGVFKHEAVAVDHDRNHLYLTEDVDDGRFYRFVPDALTEEGHPDLRAGRLEVAVVDDDGAVTWEQVPDPLYTGQLATRDQVPASTPFDGGEGIWYHQGVVYFSTKGDNRIWAYDAEASQLSVLYDQATAEDPILSGVDNVTVSASGDVIVAEDGGDMQIVAILPDGTVKPLVQIVGHDGSEITGPAFDPSGTRLYFSSQRGPEGGGGAGVTYEITGPFHEPA